MANPVVYWELWTKNPEGVSSFYEKVFGWNVQYMPEMDYRFVKTGAEGGLDGGIFKPKDGPVPGNMALYIGVDDMAAYRQKVLDAGGKIIVEETPVGEMGSFLLFQDTDNRVLGLLKQKS